MSDEQVKLPVNNASLIYQTILDLTHRNRVCSRQIIQSITGLKMTIVDDHIKSLREKGKLRMVVAGVVEPVLEARTDRAISGTWLPDGTYKLEVGDYCLELSARDCPRRCIRCGNGRRSGWREGAARHHCQVHAWSRSPCGQLIRISHARRRAQPTRQRLVRRSRLATVRHHYRTTSANGTGSDSVGCCCVVGGLIGMPP